MAWGESAADRASLSRNRHPFCLPERRLRALVSELCSDSRSCTRDKGARALTALPSTVERPALSLDLHAASDPPEVAGGGSMETWLVESVEIVDCGEVLAGLQSLSPRANRSVWIPWEIRFWMRLSDRLRRVGGPSPLAQAVHDSAPVWGEAPKRYGERAAAGQHTETPCAVGSWMGTHRAHGNGHRTVGKCPAGRLRSTAGGRGAGRCRPPAASRSGPARPAVPLRRPHPAQALLGQRPQTCG